MNTQEEILERVERFLINQDMSASAFGKDALGDPNFVFDLRKRNRSVTLRTIAKIEAFMASYRAPDHKGDE